jgi:hypothetical protein
MLVSICNAKARQTHTRFVPWIFTQVARSAQGVLVSGLEDGSCRLTDDEGIRLLNLVTSHGKDPSRVG